LLRLRKIFGNFWEVPGRCALLVAPLGALLVRKCINEFGITGRD